MKLMKQNRILGIWKPATFVGSLLSICGLILFAVLTKQVIPPLIEGAAQELSTSVMALELVAAGLLVILGFTFMVCGADPFEDYTEETTTRSDFPE